MGTRKHTPGPWEAHRASYGWDVWANTPRNFRQWIAPVHRLASPHVSLYSGSIEADATACEANANLIAAAPELFDALAEAEQFIAKTSGDGETDFRAKLRAVLAKAGAA